MLPAGQSNRTIACIPGLPHPGEVLRRDGFGEPDAVDGAVEHVAVGGHAGGVDLVDARLAVSCADLAGGVVIPGQVDVQPGLGDQAPGLDGGDVLFSGAVVEQRRRRHRLQLHVHGDGMPLIGADLRFVRVEGVALLLIRADDLLQPGHVQRPGPADPRQQLVHACPPVLVQCDPDHLRPVPQDQGDKFAGTVVFVHGLYPYNEKEYNH